VQIEIASDSDDRCLACIELKLTNGGTFDGWSSQISGERRCLRYLRQVW